MIEHFVRHGNVFTHVSIVTDPVYLTEPLVKSTDFRLNERPQGSWLWPCEYVDEVAGQKEAQSRTICPARVRSTVSSPRRYGSAAGSNSWRRGDDVSRVRAEDQKLASTAGQSREQVERHEAN